MSGIASADQITDWPHGKANVMPDHIEGVMYDFEEGSNCIEFKNQYPEIATFLTVLGTQPYGTDWSSYVTVGGSTCGPGGRCYMRIYPWCGYYPNGTPYEYVFVVNGRSAFSPMTGPDHMGGYIPGTKTHIVFKEDTRYVSFLATTGGNMYVNLYDKRGNRIHSEKITVTILRDGTNPSNFTEFSYHSDVDIVSMKISGPFNGHHIDDLIIGGAPGYLPDEPIDYSWAAERLKQLIDLPYLQYGTAWDYVIGDYRTSEEMTDDTPDPYFNFDYKQPELEFGIGINDQDAMLYAFNGNGEELINWWDTNKMAKQDFTKEIPYEEIQPGDVFFIDYPQEFSDGGYGPDGCYDEIGMVIEPTVDTTGDIVNIIRITPTDGVHYSTTEFINALHGITGFVDYRRLPDNPKGGHSPYPKKPPGKPI